jgi:hypothetical protein
LATGFALRFFHAGAADLPRSSGRLDAPAWTLDPLELEPFEFDPLPVALPG